MTKAVTPAVPDKYVRQRGIALALLLIVACSFAIGLALGWMIWGAV